jgi:hypothetical protein
MKLRRIIEQEVDKQEWGIELPNQVKLGDETLELTDRGVYQGDSTEVEYKVEDDKILTIDGEELTPIQESEFDWTSDIGDSNELTILDTFNVLIPPNYPHDKMETLSNILRDDFHEEGGFTSDPWPTHGDLMSITLDGEKGIQIQMEKELDGTWSKTWAPMSGEETIPGSVGATVKNNKEITADDVLGVKNLNESEFDWTDDVPTTIEKESDIEFFRDRDMYNIDPKTNKPVSRDEGVVVDLTYWIEPDGEEPEAYNVCWSEYMNNGEQKVCTRFRATSIVRMFNDGEFIFIDNYEG